MVQFKGRYLIVGSAVIAAAAFLGGCVPHLSQQQCVNMNWYQVGYNDAQKGNFQRNLDKAISDCAKFKLTVNASAYLRGWKAGARVFCKPANGYQLGVNGATYNNICPADLSANFSKSWHRGLRKFCTPDTGYNLGRKGAKFPNFCATDQVGAFRNSYDEGRHLYNTVQTIVGEVSAVNNQINGLNGQIDNKQNQINDLNSNLDSRTNDSGQHLSHADRRSIGYQIRDLNDQIMQIRDQISRLQSQRTRLQQQENYYNAK